MISIGFGYCSDEKSTRQKGKRLREFINDYTLIDIETTGGSLYYTEIIELAAIKVRNNKIIDSFDSLVNPMEKIPLDIVSLTGITDEMVADAPALEDILQSFLNFIGDDIVIGHNINSYDLNIIYDKAEKLLGIAFSNDFIDTLDLARCLCDFEPHNYKLQTICDVLGVVNNNAHRALSDVTANHECYQLMKNYELGRYKSSTCNNNQKSICSDFSCTVDIAGKRICLTGEFEAAPRDIIKNRLVELGAKITGNISSKTNYLLVGNYGTTTTHKITDAQDFGVSIVYEKRFFEESGGRFK